MTFGRFFNSAYTTIKNIFLTTDATQYDVKLNNTIDHLLAPDITTWATLGLTSSHSTLKKIRDGLLLRLEQSQYQVKAVMKKMPNFGFDDREDIERVERLALEGILEDYYYLPLSTPLPRHGDTINEAQIKDLVTAGEQVIKFSMMIKRYKETIDLVEDVIAIKPMSDQDIEELKHNPALDTGNLFKN